LLLVFKIKNHTRGAMEEKGCRIFLTNLCFRIYQHRWSVCVRICKIRCSLWLQNQHDQVLIVSPESAWSGAHCGSRISMIRCSSSIRISKTRCSLCVRISKTRVVFRCQILERSGAHYTSELGNIMLQNRQDQSAHLCVRKLARSGAHYLSESARSCASYVSEWVRSEGHMRICKVRCSYCFRICKISRSARLDAHYVSECVRWIAHYALESGWPNQECASLGELLSFRSLFLSLFLVSVWRIRAFWIALCSMISPISLCTQHRSWM